MDNVSRRGFFAFLSGITGGLAACALPAIAVPKLEPVNGLADIGRPDLPPDAQTAALRAVLQARLDHDIYDPWFRSLEVVSVEGGTVTVSVPVKFIRHWIAQHYNGELHACCRVAFKRVTHVALVHRQPRDKLEKFQAHSV